jgi:hypothetical protein
MQLPYLAIRSKHKLKKYICANTYYLITIKPLPGFTLYYNS